MKKVESIFEEFKKIGSVRIGEYVITRGITSGKILIIIREVTITKCYHTLGKFDSLHQALSFVEKECGVEI